MRRRLLIAGTWLFGVSFAVVVSFIAVGHVASGVVSSNIAALSPNAIDNQLTKSNRARRATVGGHSPTSTGVRVTTPQPTSVRPSPFLRPPATGNAPTTRTSPSPPTMAPAVVRAGTTATTSQGGTVWTKCSGPDTIMFVAAVPRSGYRRTVDVESGSAIEQQFTNGASISKVHAECSNGTVHAEVEDGAADS